VVREEEEPKAAGKQIVHISDDKCNVEQGEEVRYVLHRQHLVQQRPV
jgi:hypothetical protein